VKIIFFNRFFHPDASATSQLLSDLAFDLVAGGREIHVVTSRLFASQSAQETVNGVTVHRVSDSCKRRHSLFQRAISYLDYYRGARSAATHLVAPGDIAVFKTDPPMLSAAIGHLATKRGARIVLWLQDLFPEVARQYGIVGTKGPLGALLRRLRNNSLVTADSIVVIGDLMAKRVATFNCVPNNRIHVIHNWSNGHEINPTATDSNPLRRQWGLENKFIVEYSGNLGRVHEFDTMLDAAKLLRSHADIKFLVIGDGPRLAEVETCISRYKLANMLIRPPQDRLVLSQSLGVGDVHLSILRPEFEGLVHPSKLYGIMAAGRPTIFVGSMEGETSRILAESNCGVSIRTGDARALAATILCMKNDSAMRDEMGRRARESFEARYDMPIALSRWASILGS
jgi:colanic acid biosynthesis glycosyl transferase WcaI